jgi:ABC-type amino acid transport substrate-binding protein
MSADVATVVYSYFFIASALLAGMGIVARYFIKKENQELKEQLNKIMYALYNDGKTGLINKVELLLENQHDIKIDVEVLKAMGEK